MTNCDLNTVLSCLPIIGPLVSTSCALNQVMKAVETTLRIDPQGLIKKSNMTKQELEEFVLLLPQLQNKCRPILQDGLKYSFCEMLGNALTIPATAALTPVLGTAMLGICGATTVVHAYNLYATTYALTVLSVTAPLLLEGRSRATK